ncbi:MAG: O-antigen ligase family protein [Candidatus Thorarchaeota archaeon]
MDLILYSFTLLIALASIFFIIEKPYVAATLLVFSFVYRFNLNLPGPFDVRAYLTIFLFARLVIFDKQNFLIVRKYLFLDFKWILIVIFILLNFFVTYTYYGDLRYQIQYLVLLTISLILGFIIIINGQGKKVFLGGIVLAGVLTTIDIVWSTLTYSSLQIRSLFKMVLLHESFTEHSAYNQNPMGLICSYALILTFAFLIKKQISKVVSIGLILLFSLGLLISTSRSSLIAVILVISIILVVQKEVQFNINKLLTTFIGVIIFFASFYFIYHAILESGQFKSSFIDQTYYRLYEEPLSLIEGNKGKVFDEYGKLKEGNARVRKERTTRDFLKYTRLDLKSQLFGIGQGGYVAKNFGEDYFLVVPTEAHNGYINILVERGLIGLAIYILIIIILSFQSFSLLRKGLINTPLIYVLLTLIFYAIAQNSELTDSLAFLFFGAVIANTKEASVRELKNEIDKNSTVVLENVNQLDQKKSYKQSNITY